LLFFIGAALDCKSLAEKEKTLPDRAVGEERAAALPSIVVHATVSARNRLY
jgi:hypothetical protein